MIRHSGISASQKYKPVVAWPGKPEAAIIGAAELKLNKMTELGRPVFEQIA
jgi:hypothetical protein